MVKKQSIRFSFTIAEGPNAGLTTGAFKLWTSKEDTYLAPVELGGVWNLSLHADSVWRWAVTSEHMTTPNPIVPGPGRMAFDYEPVEFEDGRRLAFTICTFRHALLPRELDVKALHVRVDDSWQEVTLAGIWMTEPGVELERSRPVGDPLMLDSGRRVWVSAWTESVPDGEPEPQAVSSMIEFAMPDKHAVRGPGVFLRGVHLDHG